MYGNKGANAGIRSILGGIEGVTAISSAAGRNVAYDARLH